MRLYEFAPSPDRNDETNGPDYIEQLANRWWNAADPQVQNRIAAVLKSFGYSIRQTDDEIEDEVELTDLRSGQKYYLSADTFDPDLNEISADRLERYLAHADKHVSNRMDRMSQARQRLSKSYEIYHADRPAGSAQIVDRFEADTPEQARQYYEKFITNYESDVDFDLRLRKGTGIMEITRFPKKEMGDWGKEGTITQPTEPVKKRKLPGGSGYTFAVDRPKPGEMQIMIFDGPEIAAELDLFETRDVLDTWAVETVVVREKYRGQGLGKALYGIALSILKLTLEAGEMQSADGQRMWLMLNSIPGVEVLGYNRVPTERYKHHKGDNIIKQTKDWTRYTFPVHPGKRSMRSGRPGTGIYTTQATMIARWQGR